MKINLPAWGFALAACAPLLAAAQPANTESPKPTPQLSYQSAFADYKPWQDTKPGNWKAMNAAVGKSGGHAMDMPMSGASAPAAAASKPAMTDHSGHQMPRAGSQK